MNLLAGTRTSSMSAVSVSLKARLDSPMGKRLKRTSLIICRVNRDLPWLTVIICLGRPKNHLIITGGGSDVAQRFMAVPAGSPFLQEHLSKKGPAAGCSVRVYGLTADKPVSYN